MKKTISIHLMGTNFLVEEDAYELVRDYLDRLKNSLKNSSDQKEICEDVELRIAELATGYVSDKKEVVSFEEMKQILDTLGQPEDFLEDDAQETQSRSNEYEGATRNERRFFRDTDNGMIAGICAGLAAYFKVDVMVFRIIFVILGFAGGFIVPLYIIMWIVVPRAKTNLERLQMQGRPINLETLKEEFDDAAQRFSKTSKKFENEITDRNSPVRQRINMAASIIGKIVGIFLLLFGSIGLIMLFFVGLVDFSMFSVGGVDSQFSYDELSNLVLVDHYNSTYLWIGGMLGGLSIALFTILLGAVLLFKLKSKWVKRSFLILVLVGITGIIMSIYQGLRTGSDYAIPGEFEQKIGETADSVLNVNVMASYHTDHVKSHNNGFDGEFFEIKNGKVIESGIDINYALSEDTNFHVYVEYSARGNGKRKATERSKNIVHEVSMTGNQLNIAPYYKFPKTDKIRNQSVCLTIQIPQGKSVSYKNFTVSSSYVRDSGRIDEDGDYEHYEYDDGWFNFHF